MRVLLDHNIPLPFRKALQDRMGITVETAAYRGWERLTNGALLRMAETFNFDLLVTADKNLLYQQSMTGRRIAGVSLAANRWNDLRDNLDRVIAAIASASPGTSIEVDFPTPFATPIDREEDAET